MSLYVAEAAVVGAKEAMKLWLLWYVMASYFGREGRPELGRYLIAGVIAASALLAASLLVQPDMSVRTFISKLTGYVFFVFFAASAPVLLMYKDLKMPRGKWVGLVVALAMALYLSPDVLGSSLYLRDLSELKSQTAGVWTSASAAFALVCVVGWFALRRPSKALGEYFGLGQVLLAMAFLKFMAGGIRGFTEFSMISAVQRGVMKFVHDFVHQSLLFLMVPDHPMLKTTTWNFIGLLFGPNLSMSFALVLLVAIPIMYLYKSATEPLAVPHDAASGAERRMRRASERLSRVRLAVPVAVFLIVVASVWYTDRTESASVLYMPKPKPVIEDKGMVLIPLTDPTMDLMDGRLHKFSLALDGETLRMLVIKKYDGRLAVCLDACEVCPPEGYGQTEGHVTCVYCMTPIPIDTLGKPGGCNPIPLQASIGERDIRIDASHIRQMWAKVKSGETREAIR